MTAGRHYGINGCDDALLWTDSRSDLDIRITPSHEMALSDCYSVLTDIAQQYSVRIDGEINLPNGFFYQYQKNGLAGV